MDGRPASLSASGAGGKEAVRRHGTGMQGSGGRVALFELLVNTPAVSALIRDGKTFMLPGVMQTGKNVGMITMDESLRQLYIRGVISREEAMYRAEDKIQMREFFQT